MVRCATALEAVPIARHSGRCIVIAYASSQESVIKLVTMLKLLREGGGTKNVRTVITTQFESAISEAISEKLHLYGCTEVLREPVTERALAFKIERHIRTFPTLRSKSDRDADDAASKNAVRAKRLKRQEGKDAESRARGLRTLAEKEKKIPVQLVEPLGLESDCWLMRGGSVRQVGDRWMLRFAGPGPVCGRWVEFTSALSDGGADYSERAWQWTPHDPDSDPFIVEEGAWVFHGSRAPEFIDEAWVFVGSRPRLEFIYENESYGSKFRADDSALHIAKDSPRALSQASSIAQTWHRKIKISTDVSAREAELNEQSETHFTVEAPKMGLTQEDVTEFAADHEEESAPYELANELGLESDFWLFGQGSVRRVRGSWLVELKGPSRASSKWSVCNEPVPEGIAPAVGEHVWQWVPTDREAEALMKEEGAWLFVGLQPKFERGNWVLAGRSPTLMFVYSGESYGAKLSLRDGECLVIAKDSEVAERLHADRMESVFEESRSGGEVEGEDYIATSDDSQRDVQDFRGAAEGGEAGVDSKRFAADELDVAEYRYPLSHFGSEGGEWEYVSEAGDHEKWSAFVPVEVTSGGVADVENLAVYWLFRGRWRPTLSTDRTKWCFREKPPYDVARFVDLPKAIQEHLRSRVPVALDAETSDDDVPIVAELRSRMSVQSASFPAGTLGALDDLQLDMKQAGVIPTTQAVTQALNHASSQRAESARFAAEERQGEERPDYIAEGVTSRPLRTKNVFKADMPPGPTLGPMAMAFLMAELLSNRKKFSLRQVAHKYADYLSASCGGLRVELWGKWSENWACIATDDGAKGVHGEAVAEFALDAASRFKLIDGQVLVTLVHNRSGKLLGALVIAGEGTQLVESNYACAISDMTRGLLETLTAEGGALEKAA